MASSIPKPTELVVRLRDALDRSGRWTVEAESGWEAVSLELARSRRFEHPMGLVRLPVSPADSALSDVAATELAAATTRLVRVVDRVWTDGEDVFILLPHTTRAGAECLVERLRRPAALGEAAVGARCASYPEDALTEEVLVAALYAGAALPTAIRPAAPESTRRRTGVVDDDYAAAVGDEG
jgi:hypothetical protein